MEDFTLFKKENEKVIKSSSLADIFDDWQGDKEHWLFIAPHDDDIVLGGGLFLQKALEEGVGISAIITTDGSIGYTKLSERETIVDIRKNETLDSFKRLNVKDVQWLNYPDNSLYNYIGKRVANQGEAAAIEGYIGLQNSYTHHLRRVNPTRVFVPTGTDLHPDHKVVYQEALISLFHATSGIWEELGTSMTRTPNVYEMAVYCAFPGDPTIKISCSEKILEKKLDAIRAYVSQGDIIDKLVDKLKASEPVEYLKEVEFNLYSPSIYADLF